MLLLLKRIRCCVGDHIPPDWTVVTTRSEKVFPRLRIPLEFHKPLRFDRVRREEKAQEDDGGDDDDDETSAAFCIPILVIMIIILVCSV